MTEGTRRAVVVATPASRLAGESGATQRLDEVTHALRASAHEVHVVASSEVMRLKGRFSVGVAVSYASAGALRGLRSRCDRLWLDAVDSWLLVNTSGLRQRQPSYALRLGRDAARLIAMPTVDLATWISMADLRNDGRTIRAHTRLVLPATAPDVPAPRPVEGRRIVLAGDWDYPPNRDGIEWFVGRVMPLLASIAPRTELAVYGRGTIRRALPAGAARGYAAHDAELYAVGDVHVAPIRFGAGIKRKVLNPLVAGLPVVTTPAGAHGLRAHPLLDVRSSASALASAIAARLSTPTGAVPARAQDLADRDDSDAVTSWLTT